MKTPKMLIVLFTLLGVAKVGHSQSSVDHMVKKWERAKAYTKEYLDAMPDAGYSSKPTTDMRSFAALVLHLADANYGFTSAVTGQKSPYGMGGLEKSPDQSKATVIKEVMDSYDYVIAGIKSLTSAQLSETTKLFGRFEMTKAEVFDKDFEHQAHQRAQTVAYLHLAGVKVPAEKLF